MGDANAIAGTIATYLIAFFSGVPAFFTVVDCMEEGKWPFKARTTSAPRAAEEGGAIPFEELASPSRADNLAAARLDLDAAAASARRCMSTERRRAALDEEGSIRIAAMKAETLALREKAARFDRDAAAASVRRPAAPAPSPPTPSPPAPSPPVPQCFLPANPPGITPRKSSAPVSLPSRAPGMAAPTPRHASASAIFAADECLKARVAASQVSAGLITAVQKGPPSSEGPGLSISRVLLEIGHPSGRLSDGLALLRVLRTSALLKEGKLRQAQPDTYLTIQRRAVSKFS
ncbi:MAG: hypothetical protein M1829_006150 [Trizodia sp. TS-e1964]|nr:MAG: hypothetical protein M1829_006150 [Trizodia sp. TS-e1964]